MNEVLRMENSKNQEFCLKWNNFPNNFMSQFETLKEDEDFVDVTLYCCGQCIKAHKVILSACSPYLKNIFKEHPCKHPIIILDNLSFNNLEAVMQFIYTGQVYIQESELSSFLKAAKILQIRGLSESNSQNLFQPGTSPINEFDDPIDSQQEADAETESKKLKKKQADASSVSESDDQINGLKRDSDVEIDNKKLKKKKILKRFSNCGAKENNEYFEAKKKKDKDWCVSHNKFEGNSIDSTLHVNIVEQNFENEKILSTASGEEEHCPEELKRPHWLDPRSCPLCNRTYSNLSNLRQHMKLIHNPTFVTCKLCNKTFKTDLYLRRHISSYHELNGNGNGNSPSSMEPFLKSIHGQTFDWNSHVKLEPDTIQEMFNSTEMYQIPQ